MNVGADNHRSATYLGEQLSQAESLHAHTPRTLFNILRMTSAGECRGDFPPI
jgi:hypothetical protein